MDAIGQRTKLVAIIMFALVACGCASTQPISDADRAKVKTVKLNRAVDKGDLFLLAPSGANIGLMFGIVGGLAASGSIQNSQNAFAGFLDRNSIAIEKIVREEVELALRESGKSAIVNEGDGSVPAFNITIPQYGFGVTNLGGSKVVPVLSIKCEIVDSAGKVLWNSSDRMGPSIANPIDSITWAQMHDNPKLIEEQWRKASKYLAKKLIDQL